MNQMTYMVISDTHFGDPTSTLVVKENNQYVLGAGYQKFLNTIDGETFDYLILLGDIFDIAIKDYQNTFTIAKVFFNEIVNSGIVKKGFIYVPGNHDFEMWHLVQYEVSIINKLKKGSEIEKFRHAVPGIIDVRTNTSNPDFFLSKVKSSNDNEDSPRYGGLYLDHLIDKNKTLNDEDKITFSIAYPNLYIATDEGTVLLTHGHYLNLYWSAVSKYLPILEDEIETKNIVDYVSLNFPLNQLASSGIGQAGKLSQIVLKIESEVKNDDWSRVYKYKNNLSKINKDIERIIDLIIGVRKLVNSIKGFFSRIKKVFKNKSARQDENYLKDNKYISDYFSAVREELKEINQGLTDKYLKDRSKSVTIIKDISSVIYGHTHVSVPWNKGKLEKITDNKEMLFHNTGGWLESSKKDKVSAEIFFVKDGKISSRKVE